LLVFGNIFVGSDAPVAYVGSQNVQVLNNTIYHPVRWVIRILQETVDASRFIESGDNSFINNIVVANNTLSTLINIGPNTRPETFELSNNLWFNSENSNWTPGFPAEISETNGVYAQDPQFWATGAQEGDFFDIQETSPARGAGLSSGMTLWDYYSNTYRDPPNIGAFANPIIMKINPRLGEKKHLGYTIQIVYKSEYGNSSNFNVLGKRFNFGLISNGVYIVPEQ